MTLAILQLLKMISQSCENASQCGEPWRRVRASTTVGTQTFGGAWLKLYDQMCTR